MINNVRVREAEPWLVDGYSSTFETSRIISEVVNHLTVALSRHVHQLHRKGLHAPLAVEELVVLLTQLSRVRQGAPATDTERQTRSTLARNSRSAQHAPVPDRLLVTKKEAAERLSVSVRTIHRLVAGGMLPQVHIGSLPRFRVRDLEAYVQGLGPQQEPPSSS